MVLCFGFICGLCCLGSLLVLFAGMGYENDGLVCFVFVGFCIRVRFLPGDDTRLVLLFTFD